MNSIQYICRKLLHAMCYDSRDGIWCCFEEEQVMAICATIKYTQVVGWSEESTTEATEAGVWGPQVEDARSMPC